MFVPPRLIVRALGLAGFVSCLAPVARAQEALMGEAIDDPKLERRLGSRIEVSTGVASPVPELSAAFAPSASAPAAVETQAATPGAPKGPETRIPHLKVAYRYFNLAQLGPTARDKVGVDEPFHVLSIDFYPISSTWRLGLSTQYGWESGTFRANGDAFIAQSVSLGGQLPGPVFTPFFEGHAGGGLMQRMNEPSLSTKATAYGQLGVDFGTEVFMAKYAFLSFAFGYIRGANLYVRKNEDGFLDTESMTVDTWTLKVGFGL